MCNWELHRSGFCSRGDSVLTRGSAGCGPRKGSRKQMIWNSVAFLDAVGMVTSKENIFWGDTFLFSALSCSPPGFPHTLWLPQTSALTRRRRFLSG